MQNSRKSLIYKGSCGQNFDKFLSRSRPEEETKIEELARNDLATLHVGHSDRVKLVLWLSADQAGLAFGLRQRSFFSPSANMCLVTAVWSYVVRKVLNPQYLLVAIKQNDRNPMAGGTRGLTETPTGLGSLDRRSNASNAPPHIVT